MKETKGVGKKKGWMFWIPRVISLVFILFLALFSLDVFEAGKGFFEIVLGLFMHNIPAIVLAVVLAVFWNKGIVPGVVFIFGGLFYIFVLLSGSEWEWYMLSWILTISGPAFLVGVLFILDWMKFKRG